MIDKQLTSLREQSITAANTGFASGGVGEEMLGFGIIFIFSSGLMEY